MKKNYTAPEAEILCFRPAEELASNLTMDNLLADAGAAEKNNSSDISIKIW